ncbi:hypothetical protein [Thermodesulfatator autotrophicus]|uniref:Uncharacterized protein n=1 Tax=Thermodesulfatator autotrophicus TaxID=1795632 RepID=A0A177E8G7_9BACT|nr:hypothetical protein [Thermodesulfatator autotrophicus]OAG27309.1 hypothetical protein TH606_07500 [Thermodesulfatator autotrophicus]
MDRKLLEQIKKKVQEELVKKEAETIEYWLKELQKIYAKKHQTLPEFKAEVRQFMERMKNRVEVLKTKGL